MTFYDYLNAIEQISLSHFLGRICDGNRWYQLCGYLYWQGDEICILDAAYYLLSCFQDILIKSTDSVEKIINIIISDFVVHPDDEGYSLRYVYDVIQPVNKESKGDK